MLRIVLPIHLILLDFYWGFVLLHFRIGMTELRWESNLGH